MKRLIAAFMFFVFNYFLNLITVKCSFYFFRTWREETRGYVSSRPEASDQSGNFDL